MSEMYLVTAKTVEEAITIANREYAKDGKEINYEILEMPKKGIFGIGSRDAKLKVTVTESASSLLNSELSSIVADLRDMKVQTNRGGSESDGKAGQKPRQNQNQAPKKPQNQNQNQNAQKKADKPSPNASADAQKAVEKTAPAPKSEAGANANPRNQAKPAQRNPAPKPKPGESAIAIVEAPIALTELKTEDKANAGAGANSNAGGGRISNDIKRKPRQPKPAEKLPVENSAAQAEVKEAKPVIEAKEIKPAIEAEPAKETAEVTAAAAPRERDIEDRRRVGITEAEMAYALDFAATLLKNMGIDATAKRAECPSGEEYIIEGDANVYPKIEIEGSGTGILIGHHGETLDALQYLVNLAALRRSKIKPPYGDYVKIVVDIENYRAKREETLRSLARRMAARTVKYKRNVFLEPMNAYERRIIHSELHNYENVSTHSVGTDKNRKIIITYEGADKVSQRRSERPASASEATTPDAPRTPRRPKKLPKMPIEQLPDFLASGTIPDEEPPELED